MKKIFVSLSLVAMICSGFIVWAQPAPSVNPMTPAPVVVPMAPTVTAPPVASTPVAVDPMVPAAVDPMTVEPVMAPVTEVPAAMAAPTADAKAAPTITVAAPEPIWKSSAFWIGVVGGPVLSIIFGVLVAFKVIGQKQFDFLRRHKIVEIADKVVSSFEKFSTGTAPKWDDVLAQALRAVVDRVGALEGTEEAIVKAVVAERQSQAEVKSAVAPTEKPEEKKPEA